MPETAAQQKKEVLAGFLAPILGRLVRSKFFSIPGDIGNESRVLVIDSGCLTELLFFSPVIKRLKSVYPGMRITFLVREGNSELIRTMPQISEMITYEPAHLAFTSTTYLSLLKRVRSRDFNVAFLLGREFSFPRSLLALFSRARIRIGFSQEITFPFINCELRHGDNGGYRAVRSANYLSALGLGRDELLSQFELPEADIRWAKQMIHFRKPNKAFKLLAVDPGIGKGRHRLVDESFSYLVNNFCARFPSKVLIMSNSLDNKQEERFRSMLTGEVLDLEPKNIKEGLALLSRSDMLLSGNTDYFHFAVNMKIPAIGLFTRHDDPSWLPKGTPWVQVIQGIKGQELSLDEFFSKIDTLFHLSGVS
jgi:ADP-heptose:LPS heptosyltransferase